MDVYTDGSCLENPDGRGGWAVLILSNEYEVEIVGNNPSTTNNKMELQAVIEALEFIENESDITIYSDSQYVIKGITDWIENWIRKDWKNVKNVELWKKLYILTRNRNVKWEWVKAHANNKYNNRVDILARNAAKEL